MTGKKHKPKHRSKKKQPKSSKDKEHSDSPTSTAPSDNSPDKYHPLHHLEGDSSDDEDDDNDSQFFQGGVGDTLNGEYRVVNDLGKGTFGRVVECYEVNPMHWKELLGFGNMRGLFSSKTSGVYAVKIIRNKARYRKDAEIEAKMLRLVNMAGGDDDRGKTLFPVIHDEFELQPTGHKCLVFEKLGSSLYDVLKKHDFVGFTLESVKEISIQLFDALDHLHSVCNIVHTDIKPENLLLVSNQYPIQIKLIDFGSAVFDNEYKSKIVNTRQYRAPEILLELGWSFPSDIWAAACAIGELATGHLLLNAKDSNEHLALIEKKIGMFPRRMVTRSNRRQQFELTSGLNNRLNQNQPSYRVQEILPAASVDYIEESLTLKEALGSSAVKSGLFKLLDSCLSLNPKSRPKAIKALKLAEMIDLEQDRNSDDEDEDEYMFPEPCCVCIEC